MWRWRGGNFWKSGWFAASVLLLALLVAGSVPSLRRVSRRIAADFMQPYWAASLAARNRIASEATVALDKRTLAAGYESARLDLAAARAELARLAGVDAENRRLRQLLGLAPPPGFRQVTAQITVLDPLYWRDHFTIDKGSADGLEPGLAVLAPVMNDVGAPTLAVAGFIDSVSNHTSQVNSLFNPRLRLAAELPKSRTVGFVNGENVRTPVDNLVGISYLPLGENYTLGEPVVTSGFDRRIPANLPLGELADLEAENGRFDAALYRRGHLRCFISSPDAIRFVIIPVPEPPTARE
ncbi:MAG: rod shape-determining protein MreC [Victivallaceae bacterium]|nr:rod shape-determining protein MreC [Victivallaceae bacterium]